MTSIELVLAFGIATYGCIELIKHLVPDYYERERKQVQNFTHERIDDLEAKIAELTAKVKGAKK